MWGLDRGEEIKEYMNMFLCNSVYCILDDDDDMLDEQRQYFVRTACDWTDTELASINGGLGLTDAVKERVIKILNRDVSEA